MEASFAGKFLPIYSSIADRRLRRKSTESGRCGRRLGASGGLGKLGYLFPRAADG